jgi:predicted lipoprotein with Yx(FWY)xxD motif
MLAVVTGAIVLLAGCGSSKSSSSNGGGTADVTVAGSKLGKILVDQSGRTLYLFEADKNGKSTCSGGCAATWPPLRASSPNGTDGVDGSALATTTRADGSQQVTYHGHPLYYYAGDGTTSGSTKGEGLDTFGGSWYAVDGGGKAVEPAGAGDMGGGGGGYGY